MNQTRQIPAGLTGNGGTTGPLPGRRESSNIRLYLTADRRSGMLRFFSRSSSKDKFRTRSPERDLLGDRSLLRPIVAAIDQAIASLQAQKDGLAHRIDDALTRASITAGNDVYEHDTRDPIRTEALKGFETELASARRRLSVVDDHLTNLKFVRAVFLSRFPKSE